MKLCVYYRDAKINGDKQYNTQKPCKRGHSSPRYVSTRQCIQCAKESKHPPSYHAQWYKDNRDKHLERSRAWYKNNKVRKAVAVKEWRSRNQDKVHEIRERYCQQNPEYTIERNARRRAKIKNACPGWSNINKIKEIYKTAQWLTETTGIEFHVDHIIPLAGKTVCGLHTPENLQILSKTQNQKKHNTFEAAET